MKTKNKASRPSVADGKKETKPQRPSKKGSSRVSKNTRGSGMGTSMDARSFLSQTLSEQKNDVQTRVTQKKNIRSPQKSKKPEPQSIKVESVKKKAVAPEVKGDIAAAKKGKKKKAKAQTRAQVQKKASKKQKEKWQKEFAMDIHGMKKEI